MTGPDISESLSSRTDPQRFIEVVGRLHERLREWRLDARLVEQFETAAAMLGLSDLDDEETLEWLADLIHVSGDQGSDMFGFDLLAWLPREDRVLCVEVKTSRARQHAFHFSRRQHETATSLGRAYAILRVVQRSASSPPALALFVDPVRLAAQGDVLRLEPSDYEGTAVG